MRSAGVHILFQGKAHAWSRFGGLAELLNKGRKKVSSIGVRMEVVIATSRMGAGKIALLQHPSACRVEFVKGVSSAQIRYLLNLFSFSPV